MPSNDWNWRLATTESGLSKGSLMARGVPGPTQAPFRDFTTRVSRGPGGVATHGHVNVEILWVGLDHRSFHTVRDLVDSVGKGLLYATIYRADGHKIGGQWVDISGYPSLEDGGPQQPQSGVSGATSAMISNVLLKLNNVSILNEDPTF